jgi:hypothetical protein
MKCPRCGNPLLPGARFCFSCSLDVSNPQGMAPNPYVWPTSGESSPTTPTHPERVTTSPRNGVSLPSRVAVAMPPVELAAVAGTYLVAVGVFRLDWADGVRAAGVTAFVLASATLLAAVIRFFAGHKHIASAVLSMILIAVMIGIGVSGLTLSVPIRLLQARQLAENDEWVGALNEYLLVSRDPACDQACQNAVANGEAQAHYQYGLQLVARQDYAEAIGQFAEARAVSPSGPYAADAYGAAAQTSYKLAKQQISGFRCTDGVATLRKIVSDYGDTPEAGKAKADLATPVKVSGAFTNYPTNPPPQVWLSKSAHAPAYNKPASPGTYSFSAEYKTTLNASDGKYTFSKVRPGKYTVSWYRSVGSDWSYHWWYASDDVHLRFFQVGPVCTIVLPTLNCTKSCS